MSKFRAAFPEGDPRRGFEWMDDARLKLYFPKAYGPRVPEHDGLDDDLAELAAQLEGKAGRE